MRQDVVHEVEIVTEIPGLIREEGIDQVIVGNMGSASRLTYTVVGDTVNTASRMESHGLPGRIQVGAPVYERLRGRYEFEARGTIEMKGMGMVPAWFLTGRCGTA